uniref:Uncharacterized protein n=1 Tax=Avena sativa TaxID=4498 RepID=A0ACD5X409_AVESA
MANDGANTNTGGSSSVVAAVYVFFINLVLIASLAVCLVTCLHMFLLFHMISILYFILIMFYLAYFMGNSLDKLLYYSTIQKPYFRQFAPSGFVASMKPPVFEGVNYKRLRARAVLWFQSMSCYNAIYGASEGELNPAQEEAFQKLDTTFKAVLISILGDNIVDSYLSFSNGKDMWDALERKFGVSDAGSELYVMEQFYDYKMVDDRSIVEQAHEIQSLARELENFTCVLPDKFVVGGIIAKLPQSWRNFATSLKHKRQEFSVMDLIGTLDVEEKAREKDTRARGTEGGSNANLVQKRNFQPHKFKNKGKFDDKGKFDGKNKASRSTSFKKKTDKRKGACHVCGDPNHWAPACPNRFDKRQHGKGSKTANVVMDDVEMKDVGYGQRDSNRADGEWLACFCSWCWYGRSEVHFGKDRAPEERASCSLNK